MGPTSSTKNRSYGASSADAAATSTAAGSLSRRAMSSHSSASPYRQRSSYRSIASSMVQNTVAEGVGAAGSGSASGTTTTTSSSIKNRKKPTPPPAALQIDTSATATATGDSEDGCDAAADDDYNNLKPRTPTDKRIGLGKAHNQRAKTPTKKREKHVWEQEEDAAVEGGSGGNSGRNHNSSGANKKPGGRSSLSSSTSILASLSERKLQQQLEKPPATKVLASSSEPDLVSRTERIEQPHHPLQRATQAPSMHRLLSKRAKSRTRNPEEVEVAPVLDAARDDKEAVVNPPPKMKSGLSVMSLRKSNNGNVGSYWQHRTSSVYDKSKAVATGFEEEKKTEDQEGEMMEDLKDSIVGRGRSKANSSKPIRSASPVVVQPHQSSSWRTRATAHQMLETVEITAAADADEAKEGNERLEKQQDPSELTFQQKLRLRQTQFHHLKDSEIVTASISEEDGARYPQPSAEAKKDEREDAAADDGTQHVSPYLQQLRRRRSSLPTRSTARQPGSGEMATSGPVSNSYLNQLQRCKTPTLLMSASSSSSLLVQSPVPSSASADREEEKVAGSTGNGYLEQPRLQPASRNGNRELNAKPKHAVNDSEPRAKTPTKPSESSSSRDLLVGSPQLGRQSGYFQQSWRAKQPTNHHRTLMEQQLEHQDSPQLDGQEKEEGPLTYIQQLQLRRAKEQDQPSAKRSATQKKAPVQCTIEDEKKDDEILEQLLADNCADVAEESHGRVSVANMKARYGSTSTAATSSSVPSYMRPTHSSKIAVQQVKLKNEDAQLAEPVDDLRKEETWTAIETPGRVNVASMKARYGAHTTSSSKVTNTSVPVCGRSRTPTLQQNPKTARANQARSASAGRFRSAPPSEQSKVIATTVPPSYTVAEPGTQESSRAAIETPQRVSVSNMSSRFMRTTVSSSAKRSPSRSSAAKRESPFAVSATRAECEDRLDQEDESCAEMMSRSVIETPERVSVASMKGKFGTSLDRNSGRKSVLSNAVVGRTMTPHNTPLSPQRPHYPSSRVDHSTPTAPLIPLRNASSDPRFGRSTVSKNLPTPPWVRVDDNHKKEEHTNHISSSPTPSWRKNTDPEKSEIEATANEDPTNSDDHVPALSPRSSKESSSSIRARSSKSEESRSEDVELGKQEKEVDGNSSQGGPVSPISREHPWDREKISPATWKRRMRSPSSPEINGAPKDTPKDTVVSEDKNFLLTKQVSPVESGTVTTTHPNNKVSRLSLLRQKMLEEEDPFHEEKRASCDDSELRRAAKQQPVFSLTQMAADSIHAVDFDQAMSDLKVARSMSHDEESLPSKSSGIDGSSIPRTRELPPEFAQALSNSSNATKPLAARLMAIRAPENPGSSPTAEDGVVFGDPSTYGAAGGDEPMKPPTVADRARAVSNWKGGLGLKPSNFDRPNKYGLEGAHPVIELMESNSSDPSAGSDEVNENRNSRRTSHDSPAKRGASSVLKFWSNSGQEDTRGGGFVDESTKPTRNSTSKSRNQKKAVVTDVATSSPNTGGVSSIIQPASPKSGWSTKKDQTDPFSLNVLTSINAEATSNKGFRSDSAFDPFWDGVEESEDVGTTGFGGSTVLDFFNASIQVREEPFSPAPTTFSVPNFQPKMSDDPGSDEDSDSGFGKPLPAPSGSPCSSSVAVMADGGSGIEGRRRGETPRSRDSRKTIVSSAKKKKKRRSRSEI